MKKFIVSLLLTASIISSGMAQDLSLDEALNLARENNPELKASQLEIEKARQQRVIARASLLPSVNAGAQLNHYFSLTPFFGFGEGLESGKIPYGRFGGKDQLLGFVSAFQPLYNASVFPAIRSASLGEQQRVATARAKQMDIFAEIKTHYLQIIILDERIRLIKESINRNKRVLQDARSLFLQGKGLRVDTLRAYTAVKNLEPDLLKLSYASETSRLKLKSIIGVDSLSITHLSDSLQIPTSESQADEITIYERVLSGNPEYQLAMLNVLQQQQSVRTAKAAALPVLGFVAQYQLQSQTNSFDYGNAYYPSSSFVGLQLSVPIFNGFAQTSRSRQAVLSKDQAALNVENLQRQLRTRVHETVSAVSETSSRLKTTSIVEETARLSYTIIQYRYANGIASRIEVTDAELALSTAQSNYLEAVYDYLTALISLERLKGNL